MILMPTYFLTLDDYCHSDEPGCELTKKLLHMCKRQYFVDNLNELGLGALLRANVRRYLEKGGNTTTSWIQLGLKSLFGNVQNIELVGTERLGSEKKDSKTENS